MTNESELVTVWIATYKNFAYLNQSLKSVLTQDYPKIELFICDDGSPNFPFEEIYNFIEANRKENIVQVQILMSDRNYGTVRNVNRVIDSARGNYFIPCSSDDMLYDSNTITDIVNEFQKTGCDIMTSYRICCLEESLRPIVKLPLEFEVEKIINKSPRKLAKELCVNGNFISGAGTYYRKSFFEEFGKFDESYKLLEDYPMYLKVLKLGHKIHFFKKVTFKYRWGGISTGKTAHPVLIEDTKKLIYSEVQNNPADYSRLERKTIHFTFGRGEWNHFSKMRKILFLIEYFDVLLIKKIPNKIRNSYAYKRASKNFAVREEVF